MGAAQSLNGVKDRDARYRAMLDRLLDDFEQHADSEMASLVRQFAEGTKADGDIKTAHNDIRLLTTNLVEMEMGKNINDLKERDPKDRRRTVFKKGVRAYSVRDLTRQNIRSYFANWERYGNRIKDNYKKVFRKFLRWLGGRV